MYLADMSNVCSFLNSYPFEHLQIKWTGESNDYFQETTKRFSILVKTRKAAEKRTKTIKIVVIITC